MDRSAVMAGEPGTRGIAGAAGPSRKRRAVLVAGTWLGLFLASCQGPEEFFRNDETGLGQGGSAPTGTGGEHRERHGGEHRGRHGGNPGWRRG